MITLTSAQFQQAVTTAQQNYLPGLQPDQVYAIGPGTTILFDSTALTITLTTNVPQARIATILFYVYSYPTGYNAQSVRCPRPCPSCDRTEKLWVADKANTKNLQGLTNQFCNIVFSA